MEPVLPHIVIRGSTWQLYRRVPKRYASVHAGQFLKVSLKTDSRDVAEAKARGVWEQYETAWEAKLRGDTQDAERAFAAAHDLAKARGFRYQPARTVAELPTEELVQRLLAIRRSDKAADAPLDALEAAAIAGGAAEPEITLMRALALYWDLSADKILGKSPDQVRRWRNPRIKAIRNLIQVIGDKPIGKITGDDMLEFRDVWLERIATEGLTPNSANKDLGHIGTVLKTVNRMKRLNLVLPLSDLTIEEQEAARRPPFTDSWITDKLLAPGALDGLNAQAAAILRVMINTGCRPSEIAALTANTIHLAANTSVTPSVPHISIEPDGRVLKSKNARRVIALTGVSLDAMQAFRTGFPRYRHNSATLSQTVNKYLRQNGLLETPKHVLYSLRHSFEDRLLAAHVDERIRRDLLGHALNRERYGAGATLEMQREILQPVAL